MIGAVSLYQRCVRALVCVGGGEWYGWCMVWVGVRWLAPYRPFLNLKIEESNII